MFSWLIRRYYNKKTQEKRKKIDDSQDRIMELSTLLESYQQKLTSIIESQQEMVCRYDSDTTITFVNNAYCRMFNIQESDLLNTKFITHVFEEDVELVKNAINKLTINNPTDIIQHRSLINNKIRWQEWSNTAIFDEDHQIVEYQAVGRDITIQKGLEKKLKKQNKLLNSILESSSSLVVRIDTDNNIQYANQAYIDTFFKKNEEYLNVNVLDHHVHKDHHLLIKNMIENVLTPPTHRYQLEKQSITVSGEIRWYHVEIVGIKGTNGDSDKIVQIQLFLHDITEKKIAEQKIKCVLDEYDTLLNNVDTMVWYVTDPETMGAVNQAYVDFFGVDKDEIIGKKLKDIMDLSNLDMCLINNRKIFNEGITIRSEEYTFNSNGEKRCLSITKTPKKDLNGNVKYIVVSATDITDRKIAEDQIKENKKQLKLTLDATTDGIWYFDVENDKVNFSDRYYTMLGYEPGEFEATFDNWKKLIHPDDLEKSLEITTDYLNIHNNPSIVYENEFRLRTKSGDYRWIYARGKSIKWSKDGKITYMVGCHEDITNRKIAEQKTIESEKKYRKLINTTDTGFVIISTLGVVIDANHNYLKLTGRKSIKDIIGRNVLDWTHKSSLLVNKEAINLCTSQGYVKNIELDYIDIDNNIIPVDVNASLITTDSGEIQIIALCRNISERKERSIKLKESELRYKQLSNATFEAIFISKDGICIDLNEAAQEMFGISYDDAIGRKGIDFIHPTYRDITSKNISSKSETTYESFGLRMNGEMFPCLIRARVSGDLRITALYDMSIVKETQQKLIKSEEQFRLLAENSIDIIWTLDKDLQTTYTSPSVFDETGYTPEEFKALSLEERYDKETVKMIIDELINLKSLPIEEQKNKIMQVECVRRNKNGSYTDIKFTCRSLYKNNEFVGLQGITSNITERKKIEKKLKKSEKQYKDLIKYANEGVLISQNSQWVLANKKAEELFGITEKEIIGQSIWDFVAKEDLSRMQGYHDKRLIDDYDLPKQYTYRRLVKPDNYSKWTRLSVGIITWNNKPAHLYFISDIHQKTREM